jgi:hypothetical protein
LSECRETRKHDLIAPRLLSLLVTSRRADWISLDGGAILLILVAYALAIGFIIGGVVCIAAATFPQPRSRRVKRALQAALCFALATLFGWGLPAFVDTLPRETRDGLATWSVLWAPALATACGLLVRQLGRPTPRPAP